MTKKFKNDFQTIFFRVNKGGGIGSRFPKEALLFTSCWLVSATGAATNGDESIHKRG